MLEAELLTEKSPSGTVTERCYDASAETNTWVRFDDPAVSGTPWVGVFGNAHVAFYSAAIPFDDGRHVLVIARGQGYIVDGHTGRLVRKSPWDYSYSAVAAPGWDFVVVADTHAVWATSLDGDDRRARLVRPWFTRLDRRKQPVDPSDGEHEVVALDGIVFDAVDHDQLLGYAWWPDGWHPLHLNFEDWHMEQQDGPVSPVRDAFSARPGKGGCPTSQEYYEWMARYWLD